MTRRCAIAELASPAPNGVPGEGEWALRLPGGDTVIATVQPTKDIPGEKWIARAYYKAMEAHLTGAGCDALDAVLGILEDHAYRLRHGRSAARLAFSEDTRLPRAHRADQLELVFGRPADPIPEVPTAHLTETPSAKDEAGDFSRPPSVGRTRARAVGAQRRRKEQPR